MRTAFRLPSALAAAALIATPAALLAGPASAAPAPAGAAHAKAHMASSSATTAPTPLLNKGGKVLRSSKTYAIYWGTASAFPSDLKTGMAALLSGFSTSTYLATANQYVGGTATTTYMGALTDTTAPPKSAPSTSTLVSEVSKVLTANGLAPDTNAVYLVYTSNLPKVNYCAWHASGAIGSTTVQVAYMPNTAGTTGCYPTTAPFASTTAYSYGTRSLADNTAHEFMEAVTDPVPSTGWVDKNGAEIGDKCNFVYLAPVTLTGTANVWQIQAEWSNATNACAQTTP
jgi:hypothetical protein